MLSESPTMMLRCVFFDQHWEFGLFDHLGDDFDVSVRFGVFDYEDLVQIIQQFGFE